jgi:pimeloyl-ACP methyl ester carboxylesterase
MIWREPVVHEIPLLTQPVLFVMGENDHLAPGKNFAPEAVRAQMGHNADLAKALAAKMPDGQVEVFQGTGHLVHLEQPERFNDIVLGFLNKGRTP